MGGLEAAWGNCSMHYRYNCYNFKFLLPCEYEKTIYLNFFFPIKKGAEAMFADLGHFNKRSIQVLHQASEKMQYMLYLIISKN